jgi:hypothetical protein
MYMAQGRFRNPWDHLEFPVSLYGIDPQDPMMDLPGLEAFTAALLEQDRVLFDGLSRKTTALSSAFSDSRVCWTWK